MPELRRPVILRYFDSSFVTSAGSLLLIGPSGLGKTHLSIALGTKGATVITSNKSLANWGELVGDTALMMAIIDRLLHHGEVFYLRGSSYRMRGKEPLLSLPDRNWR